MSEITVLQSRKTVQQLSVVKSLITSAVLRAKVKASVQSTMEKGKSCTVLDETMTFEVTEHATLYYFAFVHEGHWHYPDKQ